MKRRTSGTRWCVSRTGRASASRNASAALPRAATRWNGKRSSRCRRPRIWIEGVRLAELENGLVEGVLHNLRFLVVIPIRGKDPTAVVVNERGKVLIAVLHGFVAVYTDFGIVTAPALGGVRIIECLRFFLSFAVKNRIIAESDLVGSAGPIPIYCQFLKHPHVCALFVSGC